MRLSKCPQRPLLALSAAAATSSAPSTTGAAGGAEEEGDAPLLLSMTGRQLDVWELGRAAGRPQNAAQGV